MDISLRDTRFFGVGYTLKNHWLFKVEQSINSADQYGQSIRFYVGFKNCFKDLAVATIPYAGTAWDGNYKNVGAKLMASYNMLQHAIVEAEYNPHWDSMYGFNHCYKVGLEIPVTSEFSLVTRYQTIPEYRLSVKRLRAGMKFRVRNLTVNPEISVSPNKKLKPIRVMVDFTYTFDITK